MSLATVVSAMGDPVARGALVAAVWLEGPMDSLHIILLLAIFSDWRDSPDCVYYSSQTLEKSKNGLSTCTGSRRRGC